MIIYKFNVLEEHIYRIPAVDNLIKEFNVSFQKDTDGITSYEVLFENHDDMERFIKEILKINP